MTSEGGDWLAYVIEVEFAWQIGQGRAVRY